MSLITSCPACATRFRTVADQLRVADGWVRCGRCHEVFNASRQLTQSQGVPPTVHQAPTESPAPATSSQAQADTPLAMHDTPSPAPPIEHQPAGAQQVTASDDLSFLRRPSAISHQHSLQARVLLSMVIVMLLLGLTAQIVLHERNRLLAIEPQLKPWLLAFCAPLNCKLTSLQQANSIIIEGASFTKITDNSYRLNFTVKNRSELTLAAPAIELTLTDASDQPVLRRVFSSAELDHTVVTLGPSSEWTSSLALLINLPVATPPIVGYRLYVFYA